VLPKFFYYYLDRNEQLLWYNNGTDQTNLRKNAVLDVKIAIPTIEEQERIVHILDEMEDLVKSIKIGLPAEIEARRKQYEYYRNKLLTF
jgi:type I restriction enzyme S subunit